MSVSTHGFLHHSSCLSKSRASPSTSTLQRLHIFHQKDAGFGGMPGCTPPCFWIRARYFKCLALTLQRASLVIKTPDPQSTFVVSKDFGCVSQLLPGPTESKRWVHTNAPPPHFGLGSAWTKAAVNAQVKTAQPTSCCHGRARMQWLGGSMA